MKCLNQGLEFFKKHPLLKKIIFCAWLVDARFKVSPIVQHFNRDASILDIGAGPCSVCLILKKRGYNTTAIDIKDLSMTDEITPEIYAGKKLPYGDKSFDVALLLTVLHHTKNQEEIIQEAKRTAKKIIIIEDVYGNRFIKYLMFFADSLFNLEFKNHPHSNRTDQGWKRLFKHLNLKLIHIEYKRMFIIFRQAIYVLDT